MNASTGSMLRMLSLVLAIGLGACDRRPTAAIEPPPGTVPPNTAAPTAQSPAQPVNDISDPAKGPGVEVTDQKGTETGMVGGGSGATESSTEKTEKKE